MPVALDDLGADGIGAQPEIREDLRLEIGAQVAVRPHRAADLAGGDLRGGGCQPFPAASHLERPAGALEAERRGLRVDAVGATHHHRPRLRTGTDDEGGRQPVRTGQEPLAGGAELEGEGGVDHVAAREPEMEEPPLGTDGLRDLAHEGDHVVIRGSLDLGDAIHVDARA